MKVMLDLNVFLDVLQNRKPFYAASSIILSKVINRELEGFLPAHALTTIFYVLRKFSGIEKANEVLDWLLKNFEIAPVNKSLLSRAREFLIADFEDGVVASLAESTKCEYIITRNVIDFKESPIPAITPFDFLNSLN